MKTYYGTKKLRAKPMSLGEYNKLRGWTIPENEDPEKAGYLVEYLDGVSTPNVEGFLGYVSWSPKEVFEVWYQPTDQLGFEHALVALQQGKKLKRSHWASDDYVYLVNWATELKPFLVINVSDGRYVYTPTISEIFAGDWEIVE